MRWFSRLEMWQDFFKVDGRRAAGLFSVICPRGQVSSLPPSRNDDTRPLLHFLSKSTFFHIFSLFRHFLPAFINNSHAEIQHCSEVGFLSSEMRARVEEFHASEEGLCLII